MDNRSACRLNGLCYMPPAPRKPIRARGAFIAPAGWFYIGLALLALAAGAVWGLA